MTMGVSSYSGRPKRARVRPARRERKPSSIPWSKLTAVKEDGLRAVPEAISSRLKVAVLWLRWPVSVLMVVHLVMAALMPGGANAPLGIEPQSAPPYLTWLRPVDALGFPFSGNGDGFFLYKIYTEGGNVVEGSFPGHEVAPRLRLNRYTMAGNAATGAFPAMHEQIARYILGHLPSPPLRLELFAARWAWDRDTLSAPWSGRPPLLTMKLHLVGSYNGLTRAWQPTLTDQQ